MTRQDQCSSQSLEHIRANVRGVLFDKDGTLFSFERGAGEIGLRLIQELSQGDRTLSRSLAKSAGYDQTEGRYTANSLIASGSWSALAERWSRDLPLWRAAELESWLRMEAASFARMAKAPKAADLVALLSRLRAAGLLLGVATHDDVDVTRAQLQRVGAEEFFCFVAGFGSGFAPKPDPAMLRGFCASTGLPEDAVVVIGDGISDLAMARGGGALAGIGVLSGPAEADMLAPEADLILPSIVDLPDALGA